MTSVFGYEYGSFQESSIVNIEDSDTFTFTDAEDFHIIGTETGTFTETEFRYSDLADNQFLIAPANGSVTQTLYPVFTMIEKLIDKTRTLPAILQLQISTTSDFSGTPQYVEFSTTAVDGIAPTSLLLSTPLILGTVYYWRVRSIKWSAGESPWTSVFSFTVGASVTTTDVLGTWQCLSSYAPQPQLWNVSPGRGQVGDSVTAYGIGFGDTQGSSTITIESVSASATSWGTVAALSDAYTSSRKIDLRAGYYSPEHQVITVTVPTANAPGGPFVVDVLAGIPWVDLGRNYKTEPDLMIVGPVTVPVPVSAANHDLEIGIDVVAGSSHSLFTDNYMAANGFTPSSPFVLSLGQTAFVRMYDYGPFDSFGNDIGPNTGAYSADPPDPMTYFSLIV